MSEQASLPKAGHRFCPSPTSAVMCLLTLACAVAAAWFDGYQGPDVRLVKVSILVGMVFLTVLSGRMPVRCGKDTRARRILAVLRLEIFRV